MRDFIAGAKCYWIAWRLAWREQLWPYLLLPGLISLVYFPAVAVLTYRYGGQSAEYLRERWLPDFLKHDFYVLFLMVIFAAFGLYVGFVLFRNVIMILYSPVLSFLSRKTEERSVGHTDQPVETNGPLKGMLRGIVMSLTSLSLAMVGFGICLGLLLIPILGQIAMVLLLPLIQMFLAGLGFMDPALERRDYSVGRSFRLAWRQRYRLLGCGGAFLALAAIPIVGWFLAPTLGVVAGTLMALEAIAAENHP
jgi:CysZ protein